MKKMNPRIKKAWVDALRSGEYKQCRGTLKSRNQNGTYHCCLGVLRELAPPSIRNKRNDHSGVLSTAITEWAGLDRPNPYLSFKTAVHWNDVRNLSFEEIADMIEHQL